MRSIFANVNGPKGKETTCMMIDLDQIDFVVSHGALSNGNYRYTVALKSGAVIELDGVGLLNAYKKHVGKRTLPSNTKAIND